MDALVPDVAREFLDDLFADNLQDWTDARALGEFIAKECPELLIGHLVLCRAFRHLGHLDDAVDELKVCSAIATGANFSEGAFLPELEEERRFLLL